MLELVVFTEKTLTPNVIKSLENEKTICLVLFEHGRAKEGIKTIIADYKDIFAGKTPELLTWVEGRVEDIDAIYEKYKILLTAGDIRFVDENGNLPRLR